MSKKEWLLSGPAGICHAKQPTVFHQGGVMKRFFVLGLAGLSALAGSGCATRGYARRQAAEVNDRVSQVQAQATALSAKHETDVSHANDRLTTTENKLQDAAASATQANASATQANASAARADASAAQANASAAQANASAAQAKQR
jgi:uncharacterized phage infection (PIP) family protein YhgE